MGNRKHRMKSRRYTLEWPEDHDLHGTEVTVRALRMGALLDMADTSDVARDKTSGQQGNALRELMAGFSETIVSWNLLDPDNEDEEVELPPTLEGCLKLEDWQFMAIFDAYLEAAVGVSAPLDETSRGGVPSPAALPMTAA